MADGNRAISYKHTIGEQTYEYYYYYIGAYDVMTPRHVWTSKETKFLRTNYPLRGGIWVSKQLGIELDKVYTKATREGVLYHEQGPSHEEVMHKLRNKVFKSLPDNQTIVYTLPKCGKCDQLKLWLTEKKIKFKSEWLTTSVMAEAVMRNVFGDPPLLLMNGQLIGSLQTFNKQDELIEYTIGEFVNKNLGKSVPSPYDTHVHCRKCDIWVWKHFALERCGVCGSLYRTETRRPRRYE